MWQRKRPNWRPLVGRVINLTVAVAVLHAMREPKELLAMLHEVSARCVLECPHLWKYQYLYCSISETEGTCQAFKSFDSLQIFG